jgi:high-affinity nickel permease
MNIFLSISDVIGLSILGIFLLMLGIAFLFDFCHKIFRRLKRHDANKEQR